MSGFSSIKQFLPVSSRSAHAMHEELGEMHRELADLRSIVEDHRHDFEVLKSQLFFMLWELERKDGESSSEARSRYFRELPKAEGDMRLLQLAGAKLLKDFDAFCAENGLRYWAVSGTLLGAVRHGGFIPWDDDIDVGMTRADINRAIKLVEEDPQHRITVRYDYNVMCRQVRYCYSNEAIPCFIDLFFFDPVRECSTASFVRREHEREEMKRELEGIHIEGWDTQQAFLEDSDPRSLPVRACFDSHIAELASSDITCDALEEAQGIIWGIDNVDSGVAHHSWYQIEKASILPMGRMPFEGGEIAVPANADLCLRSIYGDYYELPDAFSSPFDHQLSALLARRDVREALEELVGN